MKDLKSKTIIRALIGAIIGIGISITIGLLTGSFKDVMIHPGEFVAQIVGSAFLGFVNMGAMSIYEIEEWGLVKTTITHFVISLSTFLLVNAFLNWFSRKILVIAIIIFVVLYFFIWLIQFLAWKNEIKKMNSDLEKMIRKEEEGNIHE